MGIFKKLFHSAFSKAVGVKVFTSNPYLGLIIEQDESDVIADELFQVGMAYLHGDYDLPQDNTKASQYIRKAAEQGHSVAQLFAAMSYMKYENDSNQDVLYWLQKAAEQGEKQAMYNVGISCHRGDFNGVIDLPKSNKLIRLSAEKDYGSACERLAKIYWNGDGVEKNLEIAKFWALRAYGLGEQCGEFLNSLITTDDVIENRYNHIKIFNDAANAGDRHALFLSGVEIHDSDIDKAAEIWKAAGDKGDANAIFSLGIYYRKEKENHSEANRLFEVAANMGSEEAQNALAESYYYGLGVERDVAKAWEWNQKALNLAYTPARFLLAIMCLENSLNEIVPDRVLRGPHYLEMAIGDNYAPAIELSKQLSQQET